MAILFPIRELHRGRLFTAGEKYVRSYERIWQIRTGSSADDQFYIANNAGLPLPYERYPSDPFALRLELTVNPIGDESGTLWEAKARYSSQYDSQQNQNPLDRPVKYSGNVSRFAVPAVKDINGNPIVNLAGDLYDPPASIDDDRNSLRFTRNEALPPIAAQRVFRRAVNSDTWQNDPPRTWKIRGIEFGEQQIENGVTFFSCTYSFEYNPDTWDVIILEQGYNGVDGFGKKFKFGKDVPLLLKGSKLTPLVTYTTKGDKATYTSWHAYNEVAFSNLGLPQLA